MGHDGNLYWQKPYLGVLTWRNGLDSSGMRRNGGKANKAIFFSDAAGWLSTYMFFMSSVVIHSLSFLES